MSLKKNIIANFFGQGWVAVMGFAFIPQYIKYLGIEAYGLIGFYAVMQSWLTLFDMGISQSLNREMARFRAGAHTSQSIHNLLRSLEIISAAAFFVISILVFSISGYISVDWLKAQTLSPQTIANAVTLMGFVVALRLIEGIYKGALLGLQKQVLVNFVTILIATMRYAGVIAVLKFYESNIQIFFIWQIISSILSVILLIFFVYKALPKSSNLPKFSKQALAEISQFSGGMMGITCLSLLLTQIDKVLLSRLIDLEEYGYYTLAATMAGGLALIAMPITQAIYPKLVEYAAQQKKAELVRLYHQGAQLISIVIAPVSMMLIFFSGDIIYLWSGNAVLAEKAGTILIPLAMGNFLNCLVWMPYQLQLAYGWTGFAVRANTIAVIILVPVLFWVAPRYGAIGAAWVWALLNVGYVTIGMHFMHKRLLLGEKWGWYLNDILKPLITAIAVMFVVSLVEPKFNNNFSAKVFSYIFGLCLAICLASWQLKSIRPFILAVINKPFTKI
ncbi:oligosaccharide flippase family protein [Polynucleobacter paneuropaeus]|nr:oligosaccharide flippase family protein [Polynucleobacter paneuropaeus]